jgi:hypothetical protein
VLIVDDIDKHPNPRERGIEIAASLVEELAEVPGLAGVHIYAPTDISAVPEVIQRASL